MRKRPLAVPFLRPTASSRGGGGGGGGGEEGGEGGGDTATDEESYNTQPPFVPHPPENGAEDEEEETSISSGSDNEGHAAAGNGEGEEEEDDDNDDIPTTNAVDGRSVTTTADMGPTPLRNPPVPPPPPPFSSRPTFTKAEALEIVRNKSNNDVSRKQQAVYFLTSLMGTRLSPEEAQSALTVTPTTLRQWARAGFNYSGIMRFLTHCVQVSKLPCFDLARFNNLADILSVDMSMDREHGQLYGYDLIRLLEPSNNYIDMNVRLMELACAIFQAWDNNEHETADIWVKVSLFFSNNRKVMTGIPQPTYHKAAPESLEFVRMISSIRRGDMVMLRLLWNLQGREAFWKLLGGIMTAKRTPVEGPGGKRGRVGLSEGELIKFWLRIKKARHIAKTGFKLLTLRRIPLLEYHLQNSQNPLSAVYNVFNASEVPQTLEEATKHPETVEITIPIASITEFMIQNCREANIRGSKTLRKDTSIIVKNGTPYEVIVAQHATIMSNFYSRVVSPEAAVGLVSIICQQLYDSMPNGAPCNIYAILSQWRARVQPVHMDSPNALSPKDLYLYLIPTTIQPRVPITSFEWHTILSLLTVNNSIAFAPISSATKFAAYGDLDTEKAPLVGFKLPEKEKEKEKEEEEEDADEEEEGNPVEKPSAVKGLADISKMEAGKTAVINARELVQNYLLRTTWKDPDTIPPRLLAAIQQIATRCDLQDTHTKRFLAGHETECIHIPRDGTRMRFVSKAAGKTLQPYVLGALLAAHFGIGFNADTLDGDNTKITKYRHKETPDKPENNESEKSMLCVNLAHWSVKPKRPLKLQAVAEELGVPAPKKVRRQKTGKKKEQTVQMNGHLEEGGGGGGGEEEILGEGAGEDVAIVDPAVARDSMFFTSNGSNV